MTGHGTEPGTSGDIANVASPAIIGDDRQRTLRAGFIPLVDASVLIAAAEFGFAEREGLVLDLVKDVSWANVRDRLAFRQFDIAHMLSPMPVASMASSVRTRHQLLRPFHWAKAVMPLRYRRACLRA